METIGARVRQVRNTTELTQADFADSINMSRSNLANLENDRYRITDRVISDICAVYNVNRDWLTLGVGDMFRVSTRDEKIVSFVGEALADKDDTFRARVLELLADMDADDWCALRRLAEKVTGTEKKTGNE